MSRIFVIGAAGKVGRRLIGQLADRGHEVCAMHRSEHQADELTALGATPVFANLVDIDANALSRLLSESDVVVFSAGAGGKGTELTNAIDGRGLETAVDAAMLAGVKRFILVSAFPEALRGGDRSDGFENYMAVKKRSDVYLAGSGLDWVIVRPGTLLDEDGVGTVRAGLAIPYGSVARDDVASTLAEIVEQSDIKRVIIELTAGDTPISEAVSQFLAV